MLPTMTPKAEPARLGGHQQPFGKAAALVELDIDDIEAADRAGHIVQCQQAFVTGDRHGRLIAIEIGFAPAGERLLEQRNLLLLKGRDQFVELIDDKALVAVDAEPNVGPRGADRLDAGNVEVQFAGQLDLDRPGVGIAPLRLRPSLRARPRQA